MTGRQGGTAGLGLALALTLGLLAAGAPSALAGHAYREEVWFSWDTTELDLAVLGVEDPVAVETIVDAIEAWRTGIEAADTSATLDELVIRDYVPARDSVPPPGFEPDDVEIYVVPRSGMAASGDGVPVTDGPECVALAPGTFDYRFGPNATYRTAAHEVGHCLGLAHVFDHNTEYAPSRDIMGGGNEIRACPSNLNLQVLERVYAGETGEVTVNATDYRQVDCETSTPSTATEVLAAVGTQLPPIPDTDPVFDRLPP